MPRRREKHKLTKFQQAWLEHKAKRISRAGEGFGGLGEGKPLS